MTPLTADELAILVRARDLLHAKLMVDKTNERLAWAHSELVGVLRHSVLDTRDEAPQ